MIYFNTYGVECVWTTDPEYSYLNMLSVLFAASSFYFKITMDVIFRYPSSRWPFSSYLSSLWGFWSVSRSSVILFSCPCAWVLAVYHCTLAVCMMTSATGARPSLNILPREILTSILGEVSCRSKQLYPFMTMWCFDRHITLHHRHYQMFVLFLSVYVTLQSQLSTSQPPWRVNLPDESALDATRSLRIKQPHPEPHKTSVHLRAWSWWRNH